MMPGAEILVKSLEKEGVEVIYGYPGGASLGILDYIEKSSQIRHILVRHEQGAAHAASGYARATGKVGVCTATSGPGATNLVTGIATAYMDSIPIVAITGQVATGMVGTDAFQEVDITGITDPITKHNYLVKDASQLPRIIKEAFYIAKSGRPGPVLIDLPKDIAASLVEFVSCNSINLRGYKPKITGHNGQIKQVCEQIQEAKRPVICAGGGIISANASEELIALAEKTNIPVVNTLMGIGSIPYDHELSLGMLGTYGLAQANMVVQNCDLFIAMGMRFDDRVTGNINKFAADAKVIHIDIDAAEIGKNVRVDIPLVGDLKVVLLEMNARLQKNENEKWHKEVSTIKDRCKEMKDVMPFVSPPDGTHEELFLNGIMPRKVIDELNKVLPDDAIVTTDVGQHQILAAQSLNFKKPRTFISSGGLGTMGYGIPAAVGAQVAYPDRTVVVVTGDGSFQMGMSELGTALEQGLPLKILLLDNQCLGMVKQLQDHYCEGRHVAVNFCKNPDFHYLALAFGALSLQVYKEEELAEKMEQFIAHKGMAVLQVQVPRRDNVYPMVLGGCSLNEMVGKE